MSHALIEDWLVMGRSVKTSLPDDARLIRMYPCDNGVGQTFVFESETWDEQQEGRIIPEIEVTAEMEQ